MVSTNSIEFNSGKNVSFSKIVNKYKSLTHTLNGAILLKNWRLIKSTNAASITTLCLLYRGFTLFIEETGLIYGNSCNVR